jgi:hypothetical protein
LGRGQLTNHVGPVSIDRDLNLSCLKDSNLQNPAHAFS